MKSPLIDWTTFLLGLLVFVGGLLRTLRERPREIEESWARMNQDRHRTFRRMAAGFILPGALFTFAGFRIEPAILWWVIGGMSWFGCTVSAVGAVLPPPVLRDIPPDEMKAAAKKRARNKADIAVLSTMTLVWLAGWCTSGRLTWPSDFP